MSYVTLFTTQKMDKKTSKLGIFFARNRLSYAKPTYALPGSLSEHILRAATIAVFWLAILSDSVVAQTVL